ncbi:MAG: hypothetical protein MI861_13810 [Pirellulales bacterium]|nr:hypothetical protein [Pirellulales bacterium]
MKTALQPVAIILVALSVLAGPNAALADKPVRSSPVGRMVDTLNPANWKMPSMKMPKFSSILPARDEKARIKKKKDSLMDEVTQTASNSWRKTKETLNPKKLNPVRFFSASAKTPSTKTRDKKPGFLGSLFQPKPQPAAQDQTVTDFLGLAKPKG